MSVQIPVGTLNGRLDGVFWAGQGSSSKVPRPFMVAINGRNYLEDLEFKPWKRQAFRATTTQTTRTQADTSNEPGEQSLSTESLWRRTQDSWHLGAGQVFLDRKNSQEFSFRQSKGINVWTQWQLSLLNDTFKWYNTPVTTTALLVCGATLYIMAGTVVQWTTDMSTFHSVSGGPGTSASSMCTDGHTVWIAFGASGIYSTTEQAATMTQYTSSAIASTAVVRFVMGRLMLGTNNLIYNITTSGALPGSPLMTSLYGNIIWTDFTAGNGVIFACWNSGNVGVIYSIQIQPDGTTLSSPIVCGQLPNGETVNTIYGYAGSGVAIGTSLGFRFSEQALANGVAGTVSLTIGPLFPLPNPVLAFSGYNRFIWGSYTNYDGISTGLFRMDPTQFVSDLAPAYASDLMATDSGAVQSIVHYNGTPVFAVQGSGFYNQKTTLVPSGTIDSGLITYALADNKLPVFVDNQTLPQPAGTSLQTLVSEDGGAFISIGTVNQAGTTYSEQSAPQNLSQTMEIRQVLMSDAATHLLSPTLVRHTLRSIPAPAVPTDWTIVIQLRERAQVNDIVLPMVPSLEYLYFDNLRLRKVISTIQVGNLPGFSATIEGLDYIPEQRGGPTGEMNGVLVLTCRTVV